MSVRHYIPRRLPVVEAVQVTSGNMFEIAALLHRRKVPHYFRYGQDLGDLVLLSAAPAASASVMLVVPVGHYLVIDPDDVLESHAPSAFERLFQVVEEG